ncbi:MAG: RNA polymerase sigma factor [Bradymonadia bacterium]
MEIYALYGPALVRKATRILHSEDDARDVVQGLFLDLLKKRKTEATLPYLYQAITRRCLNHLRDTRNRQRLLDAHGDMLTPSGASTLEGRTLDRALIVALAQRLDRKRFEVMVHRYIDEMGVEEIAQLTGRSRKTIGRWLSQITQEARRLAAESAGDDHA